MTMATINITVPDAIVPKVMEALRANMGDRVNGLPDAAVARLFISEQVKRVYERYWTGKNAKSAYATANAATDAARTAQEAANAKLKADLDAVATAVKSESAGVL